MGKADKMMGGEKVKSPKVQWSVESQVEGDRIFISGESGNAVAAALDASRARHAVHDAVHGDAAAREAAGDKPEEDGITGAKTDKARTTR